MDRNFIEGVLLRCFILGLAVMVIWFVFAVLLWPLIPEVHGRMFKQITGHQFQLIHYCGMGLTKLFISVFFLIPYIAMRWTGKGQKSAD